MAEISEGDKTDLLDRRRRPLQIPNNEQNNCFASWLASGGQQLLSYCLLHLEKQENKQENQVAHWGWVLCSEGVVALWPFWMGAREDSQHQYGVMELTMSCRPVWNQWILWYYRESLATYLHPILSIQRVLNSSSLWRLFNSKFWWQALHHKGRLVCYNGELKFEMHQKHIQEALLHIRRV